MSRGVIRATLVFVALLALTSAAAPAGLIGVRAAAADELVDAGGVLGGQDPDNPFVESDAATAQHASFDPAAPFVTRTLTLSGQVQQRSYWCVPASSTTIITTWPNSHPSQSWFASAEHTTSNGTFLSNVPTPLNLQQNHFSYTFMRLQGGQTAGTVLEYANFTLSYGAPEMVGLQGGLIGWWIQHGFTGNHAMVIYGNAVTNGVQVWDPLAQTWAGKHSLSASDAANAMNATTDGQVW